MSKGHSGAPQQDYKEKQMSVWLDNNKNSFFPGYNLLSTNRENYGFLPRFSSSEVIHTRYGDACNFVHITWDTEINLEAKLESEEKS